MDMHMAQLMPLTLTVSCFSKIQIGSTFLAPAHPGSHGRRAVKRVCVCVLCTVHNYMRFVQLRRPRTNSLKYVYTQSVCLSASVSPKLYVRSSPDFSACYLWPWLGHALLCRRCDTLCISGSTVDVVSARNGQEQATRKRRILQTTRHDAARI